jgi:hypothetical protein
VIHIHDSKNIFCVFGVVPILKNKQGWLDWFGLKNKVTHPEKEEKKEGKQGEQESLLISPGTSFQGMVDWS